MMATITTPARARRTNAQTMIGMISCLVPELVVVALALDLDLNVYTKMLLSGIGVFGPNLDPLKPQERHL